MKQKLKIWTILLFLTSCSSYEQFRYITEEFEIPQIILVAEFTQTWQAVLQVMRKYDIAVENRQAGIIRTRWIDNTQEKNFADSFSKNDEVKSARFKLIINVVKGFRRGREVAKVTVYKRQFLEQGFLQGWKEVPSDGITEKSILYRIQRKVAIDNKLRAIEKLKEKEQLKNF
jgi:hypothetical protein